MSHQSELISEDILEYLKQHEQKELLRLLTCGSVDDGKSTLIGRLLHDSKMIYEDQLEAIKKDSAKSGNAGGKLDLSLLVDGLQAEREQGITIDVAYRFFSTAKRKFIIADTPGHEQYTRNMATGASTAQLAIILVDARYGVLTQTRRHTFIASLLGIRHVVVAINKMDLVDYSQARYDEIREDYLAFSRALRIPDLRFIPLSALDGDNVVDFSENMPWYKDLPGAEPLMHILENVAISDDRQLAEFRMPVQYVNRPNLDFRGFAGTIASGVVRAGDEIMALPSRRSSRVKSIVTYDGDLDEAFQNQAVTLTLTDEIDVSRGDVLVKKDHVPTVGSRLNANIVWMTDSPLVPGKQYAIKLGTTTTFGSVTRVLHQIDVNTLQQSDASQLGLNEIGLCELALTKPIVFDPYQRNHLMGAFIIIDRLTNVTVGAGMVDSAVADSERLSDVPVAASEREARRGHASLLIEVQGPVAAKLACTVERVLFEHGLMVVAIDEGLTVSAARLARKAHMIVITQSREAFETGNDAIPDLLCIHADTDDDIAEVVDSVLERLGLAQKY
ncbi:MAG: sulfate adenylyltransferase subunit CysN [unclassified Hahellaceae]|nr:sulfate adenylyltransferase subunit CysN [Hahellaceae bacterium]|tara:strand:- start:7422 stop:9098 length:1677 start_codon:yes stop_codon:yes gene_type:complete